MAHTIEQRTKDGNVLTIKVKRTRLRRNDESYKEIKAAKLPPKSPRAT